MSRGDFEQFDWFHFNEGRGNHDIEGATIKFALVTNAVVPTRTTPDPRWGPGGITNFAAQEVTPGGNYVAGGEDTSSTFVKNNGTSTHTGSVVSWAANAGNPQNASWAIMYDDTDAGKRCIAFADLGGVLDMRAGPLTLTPNAAGFAVKGRSAGPV